MKDELAECGNLFELLKPLGKTLDQYLQFGHSDAMQNAETWRKVLNQPLPLQGIGIKQLQEEIGRDLIPNASQIPNPGCSSFITTGATSAGILATVAATVSSPQRFGMTAFNFLEELSLDWMVDLFELPSHMKGIYSSGGSIANLLAMGAARQIAFEQLGINVDESGVLIPGRIYTTEASHRTIYRAAAVLGLGRKSIVTIESDDMGRMKPEALSQQLAIDKSNDSIAVAIVANAGVTSTGAIDPLAEIGKIAKQNDIWFHVDGAYGLPGILDPLVSHLYDGLDLADSITIDPHKWLGAPVGIGVTLVRDRAILHRAFQQGESDYLEGSFDENNIEHSMDSMGIPYSDFGVELSAPARGAVVWALIKEIGKTGIKQRICRHNAMARLVAERAEAHPNLEVLQKPTLSICCFRYLPDKSKVEKPEDINNLNRKIHRTMVHRGISIPSTAMVHGKFAIRPCFIGARTTWKHVDELIDEVVSIGDQLVTQLSNQ